MDILHAKDNISTEDMIEAENIRDRQRSAERMQRVIRSMEEHIKELVSSNSLADLKEELVKIEVARQLQIQELNETIKKHT